MFAIRTLLSLCQETISSSAILTILTLDLNDGLALIPGKKTLPFISPTILIFKVVFVLLTISPTNFVSPS